MILVNEIVQQCNSLKSVTKGFNFSNPDCVSVELM